jgi:hypothetical protein
MKTRRKCLATVIGLIALAAMWAPITPSLAQPAQPKGGTAASKTTPAPLQPAQIDRNGVLILIRSTLLAVHHGNQTGNYTVLRDLGAAGFQSANNAARLAEIFANLRARNLDLSGVAVLEPQLTVLPEIDAAGMMRMAGFFPSVPLQVNFELLFAPADGRWRLFGISLNVGQSSPVAPPGPEAPKPEASKSEPSNSDGKAEVKPGAPKPAQPANTRQPVPARPPPQQGP